MGKKKQKVRWTAVEEATFFSSAEDSSAESRPAPPANAVVFKREQQQHHPYPRRHNNWGSGPVAPRFERRSHHRGGGGHPRDSESDIHTELLPDGFTKIRSKNLDVLFKRDYYAQKTLLEASRSTGSSVRGEGDEEASDDESSSKSHTDADVSTEGDGAAAGEAGAATTAAKDAQDEDVANGHDSASVADDDSAATSPYYLNQQFAYAPTYVGPQNPARTNLFLYSPSSNTMIPCEEIIIPNPVLGPDGGPLYQGPSNIYLAFPMENNGAGGTAVIPQPFMSPPHPYDQYGVPYSAQAFPGAAAMCAPVAVMSSDASMYHSSSSDNSSTEPSSADSTMPHSPPDLSGYSPATWVDPVAHFDQGMVSPSYLANQIAEHQSWYQNNNSVSAVISEPTPSAPAQEKRVATVVANRAEDKDDGAARTTSAIPGLHPEDRFASSRRVQKKKKRKKKPAVGASSEKRGSTSSEDNFDSQKSNDSTESPELDDAEQVEVEIGQQKTDAEEAPLITVFPPEQSNAVSVRERSVVDAGGANKESSEQQPPLMQSTCSSVTSSSPNLFSAPEASVPARPKEFPNSKHSEIAVNRKACDDVAAHDNIESTAPIGDALTCLRKASSSAAEKEAADSTQGATQDVDTCNNDTSRGPFAQSPPKFTSDKNKNRRRGRPNPASSFSQTQRGKPASRENVKSCAAPPVPKPAERTDADGWEVQVARNKKSKGRRLAMPSSDEAPLTPVQVEEVVAPTVQACRLVEEVPTEECSVAVPACPVANDAAEESKDDAEEETSAAADEASRKKRNKRRKMQPSQDAPRPSVRQVLIQDGQFQVTSYRQKKSASEMLDEDLLAEAIRRGQLDALYISSIGHGMLEGPITVGRFGQCRYTPPDRSDEIPIELRTMPPEKTASEETEEAEQPEEETEPKETETKTAEPAAAEELSLD